MAVTTERPKTADPRNGWKPFGWQGLSAWTPASWNLVAYGGDARTGNVRLDDGNSPEAGTLGMEVRWSTLKGDQTDADLERRLRRYFDSIQKSARRQKIASEVKSKAISDPRPERDAVRSFSWRADRRAVGRIWHCRECGRLTIAQVLGGGKGDLSHLAAEVLQSLECHPPETGWQSWSLYDLTTQVPAGYLLRGRPQLMNIYVQLAFEQARRLDILLVEQWGVANAQLKGVYLDEWFRKKNAAQEPSLRYEAAETAIHGHPALALHGRRAGPGYWLGQALPQLFRGQRPAPWFAAFLWECPESNKVYLIQGFSRRPDPDRLREIAERTPCHC